MGLLVAWLGGLVWVGQVVEEGCNKEEKGRTHPVSQFEGAVHPGEKGLVGGRSRKQLRTLHSQSVETRRNEN